MQPNLVLSLQMLIKKIHDSLVLLTGALPAVGGALDDLQRHLNAGLFQGGFQKLALTDGHEIVDVAVRDEERGVVLADIGERAGFGGFVLVLLHRSADELRLEPVKGKAMDRALAYLAHGESPHPICPLFGDVFGTIYDISTILILWFAGASAMGGLLNMVPRYLPRYGMAPEWAGAYRPLVIAFTVINLVVTLAFRADVSAQGGAYATGVLVLMTSACVASFLHEVRKEPEPHHGMALQAQRVGFGLITLVFIYTTIANIYERPDGIIIASIFIATVMAISFTSRFFRSDEMRLKEFRFADDADRMLWTDIVLEGAFRVLVPHRPGSRSLADKEAEIRRKHRIPESVPLVFLEVHYGDVSEFQNSPILSARQDGNRFIIVARDVVSVSHTIAQVAMEMTKSGAPLDIVFGWSKGGSLKLALDYVLFGQGDVPNRVVDLLDQAIADPTKRPTVIVG